MTHVAKRRTQDAFLDVGLSVSAVWAARAHELESRYGQRRGTAERFHRSVDWADPAQVDRALQAWSRLLDEAAVRGRADTRRLLAVLSGEGLVVDDTGAVRRRGAVAAARRPSGSPEPPATLADLDLDLDRVRLSLDDDLDPTEVVARAVQLVEATARTVLGEHDRALGPVPSLPELVLRAHRDLGVALRDDGERPGGTSPADKVLGAAGELLIAVVELRDPGRRAGRDDGQPTPGGLSSATHARLVLDAAAAWCGALLAVSGSRAAPTEERRHGDPASAGSDGSSVAVPSPSRW